MRVPKLILEKQLQSDGFANIAGVDEVGRGAWAGPLVAAAVVLRNGRRLYRIRDSKLLTAKHRQLVARKIKRRCRAWAIGLVEVVELNKLGLTKSVSLAQTRAIRNLKTKPDIILCDGRANYWISRTRTNHIVKGDRDVVSIAAASIIAKVYRDKLMARLAKQYPQYHFEKHKGYGTKIHQRALRLHGICDEHRTFYKTIAQFKKPSA